jgi:hypothetical protein
MVKKPGEIFKEFRMRVELLQLDNDAVCAKGDLLIATADGWEQATATLADSNPGKYAIALAAAVAGVTVRALVEGAAGVNKLNNTVVAMGQPLGASATGGSVDVVTAYEDIAGFATESAISGDKSVGMFLSS